MFLKPLKKIFDDALTFLIIPKTWCEKLTLSTLILKLSN